jgi:hypothetical protein
MLRRPASLLVVVVLCAACVPQGLAFRIDDRLTITAPGDREQVALPVTLRWDVEDFDVVEPGTAVREDAGYFAVFVDRSPVPPGRTLSWLARDDAGCRSTDGCPDAEYLAARGVHATTETELVLQELPRAEDGRRERHTATIVLLDGSGKRIGESAFEVVFEVERDEQS